MSEKLVSAAPAVDFNNTELAFKAKSNAQLKRTYFLYKMVDSPLLTKIGPPLLNLALKFRLPVEGLVRKTLFELFVGGDSLNDTVKTSEYLKSFNVLSILDYAVEGEKSERGFDKTRDTIIATLTHASKHGEVPFIACKLTGLGNFDLMAKVQAEEKLNKQEAESFERFNQRVDDICKKAADFDMPIFIDAEETWIQDIFDEVAEDMMEKYNRKKAIVATTVQMYRWDRLDYVRDLIQRSKEKNYMLGIKIVRGAYLEKETLRSQEMGYKNPMQANKAATDRDYNAALKLCLDNVEQVETCVGTHNEESCYYLTQLMHERGIPNNHPHVLFSQLLGMSDHISFNLATAGYFVAKYVPYGPIRSVIPYLLRRAEENTAISGQSSREVELLKRELERRKM